MKFASLLEPAFSMGGFFTVTLKRKSYKEGNVGDNVGDSDGINVGIDGEAKFNLASFSPFW